MADIADRMRQFRKQQKLTQKEMAEKLDIPYRTLQDGERGLVQPGASTLAAYGEHDADLNWLVLGRQAEGDENQVQPDLDKFSMAVARSVADGIGRHITADCLAAALKVALEPGNSMADSGRTVIANHRD